MNYFSEKIIHLIESQLLNFNEHRINKLYQSFEEGEIEKIENHETNKLFHDFLNQPSVSKKQFDLPFFIDNKKEKTLMIIGMDAKASHSGDHIVLSTPYYLQAEA